MSETVVKMAGLACMVVSVFLVLFGLYGPEAGSWMLSALVTGGVALFIVGSICYTVYRKS